MFSRDDFLFFGQPLDTPGFTLGLVLGPIQYKIRPTWGGIPDNMGLALWKEVCKINYIFIFHLDKYFNYFNKFKFWLSVRLQALVLLYFHFK